MSLLDDILKAYSQDAKAFDRRMDLLQAEVNKTFNNVFTDILERLSEGFLNSADPDIVAARVNKILFDSFRSLPEEMRQLAAQYVVRSVNQSNAIIQRSGADLSFESGREIVALPQTVQSINAVAESIDQAGYNTRQTIENILERYYTGVLDFDALLTEFDGQFGKFRGLGYTVSNTMVARTDREYRVRQAEKSGADLMIYVGPDDSVTRPFCAEHINLKKPLSYWQTIRNDVNPNPPSVWGGGWNCRHRLLPWKSKWDVSKS